MNKKRLMTIIIILIVVFVVVFTVISMVLPFYKSLLNLDNRIFGDISELNAADEYIIEAASDKNLRGEPVQAYSNKLEWNDEEYTVHAYVFDSVIDSQEYFEKLTGKTSDLECNFSLSSNYFTYARYVVYNNNTVFVVTSDSSKNFVEFIHFINSNFTIDVKG